MGNWWKNPVLQGPENDYGQYDYLVNELPKDSRVWNTWGYKCSECGKYHKINRVYTSYFYTMDGYDYMSTEVCWRCECSGVVRRWARRVKNWWKVLITTVELKRESWKKPWKRCYNLAKILCK